MLPGGGREHHTARRVLQGQGPSRQQEPSAAGRGVTERHRGHGQGGRVRQERGTDGRRPRYVSHDSG